MKIKKIYSLMMLTALLGNISCSILLPGKKNEKKIRPTFEIKPGPSNSGANFEDITAKVGLEGVTGVRFYSVDLNNDNYSDLVVLPTFYSQPRFFYYDNDKKIYQENKFEPFSKSVSASFLMFYDLDHDDVLDLVVGVLNQKTELTKHSIRIFKGSLINKRIWFTELTDVFESTPNPTASVSLLDVDLDGELDIFQANWYTYDKNNNPWPVRDRLFLKRNNRYQDFSKLLPEEMIMNETKESYIKATPSFASSTCDIDNNGFPDILTASSSGYENKLWLNEYQLDYSKYQSNRIFKNYGRQTFMAMDQEGFHVPRGGGNSFSAVCADYNNDGMMDIYVGEMTHSYDADSVDRSSVLTGISVKFPPKFMRTEYLSDSTALNWSRADKRGTWVDLNMDGLLDILVDNSGFPPDSRLVFFSQEENHDFVDLGSSTGIDILNPEGSIILDINKDGKPDIITGQSNIRSNQINPRIYLFQNNLAAASKNLLRVYPRGIKANSSALGAMLTFFVEENSQIKKYKRYVEYSNGNLPSQHEEGIFFNLSKTAKLKKIDVRFPIYSGQAGKARSYLERSFSFEALKLKDNNEITLCEDGRVFFEKKLCR